MFLRVFGSTSMRRLRLGLLVLAGFLARNSVRMSHLFCSYQRGPGACHLFFRIDETQHVASMLSNGLQFRFLGAGGLSLRVRFLASEEPAGVNARLHDVDLRKFVRHKVFQLSNHYS